MKKEKKKSKWLSNLIIFCVFLLGAGILAYPTVSDMWNSYRNARLISHYAESVETISEENYDKIWEEAREYNAQHKENYIVDAFSEESEYEMSHPYDTMLDPNGDGLMGSIDIPKIGEKIAIFHGLGTESLERGCGHVEGTSLPIGGKSTHAALAAHRGLPSAKLFTDLDQLQEGDVFILNIMDEKLAYEVDQIKIVLPEVVEDLEIVKGEDHVTLITCTPYGVNTHRLLVRGKRTEYVEETMQMEETVTETIANWNPKVFLIAGLVAFAALVVILYFSVWRKKEVRENENKK